MNRSDRAARIARALAGSLASAGMSFLLGGVAVAGDEPCAAFKWNVTHERALFATAPKTLQASPEPSSPATLAIDRLYDVVLTPQDRVQFAAEPGKKTASDHAYAGVARLHVAVAGVYRISLDQPAWVDVVNDGQLVRSADFAGQQGCRAPHKIVVYELPAGDLLLQLSNGSSPHVLLTVTQGPRNS